MARKQLEIVGTERKTVKEVDDAAEAYVEQRDKRMKLTEKEKVAKDALIAVMRKHELTVYRDVEAGLTITLASKDNVKVTSVNDEEGDDGDEGEVLS